MRMGIMVLLCLSWVRLWAAETVYKHGTYVDLQSGQWPIHRSFNIGFERFHEGNVVIVERKQQTNRAVELAMEFGETPRLEHPFYHLQSQHLSYLQSSRFPSVGLFASDKDTMALLPKPDALLFPGKLLDSFTLQMSLFPYAYQMEQTILRYSTHSLQHQDTNSYGIKLSIRDHKLRFLLENIIVDQEGNRSSVELVAPIQTIPPQTIRVSVAYEQSTGQLSLSINKRIVSSVWLTETREKNDRVLEVRIPSFVRPVLRIGSGSGFALRSLLLQRGIFQETLVTKTPTYAFLESTVLPVGRGSGGNIIGVQVQANKHDSSHISMYYRASPAVFPADLPAEQLPWVHVEQGDPIPEAFRFARYAQIRLDVFVDPQVDTNLQILNALLFYNSRLNPDVPTNIEIQPMDRAAQVSWKPSFNSNVLAYEIFVGTNRNYYDHEKDLHARDPIVVPQSNPLPDRVFYEVDGLENHALYSFQIRSVDRFGNRSAFSPVQRVRPTSKKPGQAEILSSVPGIPTQATAP